MSQQPQDDAVVIRSVPESKDLFVLEHGKWESSVVLGVFDDLESAETKLESLGGELPTAPPLSERLAKMSDGYRARIYPLVGKPPEWFRVTMFRRRWE